MRIITRNDNLQNIILYEHPFSSEQLAEYLQTLSAEDRGGESETLAKRMVRDALLTEYQAQVIHQGKHNGLVLGKYRILSLLGRGGMGMVFEALDTQLKRIVAIKVLTSKLSGSKQAISRFRREIVAVGALNHPNIVLAIDACEHEGAHFLVLEYVEGSDLSKRVKEGGPLSITEAVRYITQAATGLEYAHNKGIIHRDIKPHNLLLTRDGVVKIADFGLARAVLAANRVQTITDEGQVFGTVDFMAPEQADDAHTADERADIYSLGCTLHYLLTGRPPYEGNSFIAKLVAHIEEPIPSICAARKDVSPALDEVFRRCVAKAPTDRFASMSELLLTLKTVSCGIRASSPTNYPFSKPASKALADNPGFEGLVLKQSPNLLKSKRPASRVKSREILGMPAWLALTAGGVLALFLVLLVFSVVSDLAGSNPQVASNAPPQPSPVAASASCKDNQARISESDPAGSILADEGPRPMTVEPEVAGNPGTAEISTIAKPVGNDTGYSEGTTPDGQEATAASIPLVRITRSGPEPPLAVAPFDAAQARKHQEAWAAYHGVSVEWTNSIGMKFVLIPPGEFGMGSTGEEQAQFLQEAKAVADQWAFNQIPTEGPQHRVRITKPFRLGRHEVTVGQFYQFVDQTGYKTEAERDGMGGHAIVDGNWVQNSQFVWNTNPGFEQTDTHPVVHVSWNDAMAFCDWLSEKEDAEYVLPTEAQWEYVCRAGTTTFWHCGESEMTLEEYGWFASNSDGATHSVGQLKPNGWGLYDMHGNVWEWCADRWSRDYYGQSPANDPSGPPTGSRRVIRGGVWLSAAVRCRSAHRNVSPYYRSYTLGFRIASVLAD